MSWSQTYDGKAFDLESPDPDMICPEVISIVLARTCRFGGHCRPWYSVAQHSLIVEELVEDPTLKLAALLHDAHEAYSGFGDVQRPAKYLHRETTEYLHFHESRINWAIAKRFGIEPWSLRHDLVKHADDTALATERRDVMAPCPKPWVHLPEPRKERIVPLDMDNAQLCFIRRLRELMGK